MDLVAQLSPHINGQVFIKEKGFTLESVEEDHLVLRDEDSMHTMVWFSSIQGVREIPPAPPEIILFRVHERDLD